MLPLYATDVQQTGEVAMFATIKSLIPEPRQADQPRNYVGRHRQPENVAVIPGQGKKEPQADVPEPAEAS